MKQTIIQRWFALVLIILITFNACSCSPVENAGTTEASSVCKQLLPMDQELTLTIYFQAYWILTGIPLDQDSLMRSAESQEYVITVESEELSKHSKLFASLDKSLLIPITPSSDMDARLCYIFRDSHGNSVFEYVTNHYNSSSAWVNGEVVANKKSLFKSFFRF